MYKGAPSMALSEQGVVALQITKPLHKGCEEKFKKKDAVGHPMKMDAATPFFGRVACSEGNPKEDQKTASQRQAVICHCRYGSLYGEC